MSKKLSENSLESDSVKVFTKKKVTKIDNEKTMVTLENKMYKCAILY